MGRKRKTPNMKKSIAFVASIVGTVLCFLTFLFVSDVKSQLWEQSIGTIMESTKQGCYTLEMQLMNDYQTMEQVADYIKAFDSSQTEEINQALQNIAYLEKGITLHLSDGTVIPGSAQLDEEAAVKRGWRKRNYKPAHQQCDWCKYLSDIYKSNTKG